MVEKLKILKHHVELIREKGFGTKGRESISEEILLHARISLGVFQYPFDSGISRRKFAEAMREAAVAVLDNNFEEIPDFKDESMVRQNYDLICFKCPNYELGDDICRVAKIIKEEVDGSIPSRSTKKSSIIFQLQKYSF